MPTITMMPLGINGHFPGPGNPAPPARGNTRGLTPSAARRCKKFLMSIDPGKLTGHAFTYTFTLPRCPETSDEWGRLKKALFRKFKEMGCHRHHHVTEWTRRGVPHLHGFIFFHDHRTKYLPAFRRTFHGIRTTPREVVNVWLEITKKYGTLDVAQHVQDCNNDISARWFQYLSKHSSRSARHYQRDAEKVPKGWKSTGSMWGKSGSDWPIIQDEYEIPEQVFHRLRRIVRAHARSRAITDLRNAQWASEERRELLTRQAMGTLQYLRSQKKITNPKQSAVRPISEWVVSDLSSDMIEAAYRACPPSPADLPTQSRP